MSSAPSFIAEAAKADAPKVSEDTLEKVRVVLRETRDRELEIRGLEERLRTLKTSQNTAEHVTLPTMFQEANIDKLGLPAEGNLPAYDTELKPYYHANISSDWPPEQREEAFSWLTRHSHGDLIKSVVVITFPREEVKKAKALVQKQQKLGRSAQIEMTVPWNTLTAWLKEQVEKFMSTPPLDKLGATVGRVVKLKPRKEK